jgi:hypothetical protein
VPLFLSLRFNVDYSHFKVKYDGKGYFSGKAHSFTATLSAPPSASKDPIIVEGTWDGASIFKSKYRTQYGDVKGSVFYQVPLREDGVEKKILVTACGGEEDGKMGDFETRQLWGGVARGIRTGDFDLAHREKSKIEVRPLFGVCIVVLLTAIHHLSMM